MTAPINKEEIYGLAQDQDDFLSAVRVLRNVIDFAKARHTDFVADEDTWYQDAADSFKKCLAFLEVDLDTIARIANSDSETLCRIFEPGNDLQSVEVAYQGIINYTLRQYPRGDWRYNHQINDEIENLIAALRAVIDLVSKNNFIMSINIDDESRPITASQRQILLALSKSLIEELTNKSPVTDRGRLAQTGHWLKRLAKRGVEKGMEKEISDHINSAADAAGQVVDKLADMPGFDNIPL